MVNSEFVTSFIDQQLRERIVGHDWASEGCTAEITAKKVDAWQQNGSFVVANAGGYDAMGLNHIRGLVQARIIGAVHQLGEGAKVNDVFELASSDEIRLLVSVDTNRAIEENKSFKPEGKYTVRPLLDWNTRAATLALQAIGGRHDLVDFVTKHGPGACTVCKNETCSHSSKTFNIAESGADLVVIKQADRTTFNRYPNTSFHVIDEAEGAFIDRLLGEQISTSALVRRIKGKENHV